MSVLQDAAQLSACWVCIGIDTEPDLINRGPKSLEEAIKTKNLKAHINKSM